MAKKARKSDKPKPVDKPKTLTSVDVECLFSKGHILLSHIRNRLFAQSTRALLCLNNWSAIGLVIDNNVIAATKVLELADKETEAEVVNG